MVVRRHMAKIPTGTVTFLFTDVEASTRRWEDHPNEMKGAMATHDEIVRSSIEGEAGHVFTTAGDAFCAAFSSPHDAVDAAIEAQRKLEAEAWGAVAPFRIRMALHTGNADERDGDYFGPPLNRCARLLATGHGGQIIVSSATAQLLKDDAPSGVRFEDLGAHELKDLDVPEHVFQVRHADLTGEFPPLRSENPVQDAKELLASGRAAHASEDWEPAYQALAAAAAMVDLDGADLHRLSESAYWTGRSDEHISLGEMAYGGYMEEGNDQQAALVAIEVAQAYKFRLAKAISSAWMTRARRLVVESSGSEAEGYLLRTDAVNAFEASGDSDRGLELAIRVAEIGRSLGNRSLEALGLQDQGRFLVAMGRIDEGMAFIDEAMAAAVAGELDPDATGRSYCNMLDVCDQIEDYERANEWSDAAQAWCEQHSDSSYPGVCRVFRAELKRRRGDWDDATEDLNRAIDELTGFTPIIGAALYQIGEVDLRAGRLVEADERFRSANEHGYSPMPGIAQLRLRQGDAVAAEQLLQDAMRQAAERPLARARLLPSVIEVELALGHSAEGIDALAELESAASTTGSTAMRSAAAHGRGALALSESRTEEAARYLQDAIRGWTGLQMPYEAAQSRMLLGEAQMAEGRDSAARMELESARSAFDRLGAVPDTQAVDALLAT
jgi:class 3 adenylate cyclase